MSAEPGCRETRELVPELALGILMGEERARALAHVAQCASCGASLSRMTSLVDEMLLLAPANEPPAGFESRVLDRIAGAGRAPRRRRWLAVAAAALVGLASAGAVLVTTKDERDLAADYRDTLRTANGSYFSAAPLRSDTGRRVGTIFGYQGSPSWTFVVVSGSDDSGRYRVTVKTENGRRVDLGSMTVSGGRGMWGAKVPIDFHDVEYVELESAGEELEAVF